MLFTLSKSLNAALVVSHFTGWLFSVSAEKLVSLLFSAGTCESLS